MPSDPKEHAKITINGKEYQLSTKQEFFCRYYVSNGFNGTQAAISAGYSKKAAKQTANENLTKPYLKAFIDKLKEPVLEKLKIDENWVINKLHIWSEVKITDFFNLVSKQEEDEEGKKRVYFKLELKDLNTIPDEKLSAIEEIQELDNGKWKLKLVGKKSCVIDIGKHLGMFTEKFEGTVNQNIDNKTMVFIIPTFNKEE